MISSLTGTASLEASNGSILGVNLEEALRRSHRRPIDVERDMRLGATTFDKVEASLAVGEGRAQVRRGVMTSHGVKAELDGLIELIDQSWALQVEATQTDAAGEASQDAAHLTFDIAGPWSQPTIRVIRRLDGAGGPAVALSAVMRRAVCASRITQCKFVQIKPNKRAFISLYSLGFLWRIWDFSKGYGESK